MKKRFILLQSIFLLLLADNAVAQLKLGDQPTSIQKAVILDLQGTNGKQGVWLPRVTDTTDATGIDALNPPDGVMIYYTPAAQVMIRKNGFWNILLTSLDGVPQTRMLTINGTTYDLSANRTWNVGTVTSIANGYGINGGTITSSGTFSIDTLSIATRSWRQKGLDSMAALIAGYVPSVRTLNGLALSSNQTFATGTSGTDFNISSSGTTHTFNIPTASATNRGLLSSADWTTFNNKGTVSSVAAGYGINGGTITTTGTHSVDTLSIATRAWRQKGIDSIAALLSGYALSTRTLTINGSTYDLSANRTWNVGTVTSIANGYGINGGTITSSGTFSIDTLSIATRSWRQKGLDSMAALIAGYVPSVRTLNGLALSSNQTFATGTSGTDFNISSSGTTHTFNIPTASATNRGLLSSADWTTFNNKGTVSSVAAGYGINGGTITTTGTHSVDTLSIATRAWRQKGIDSVAGLLNSYIPSTRTLTINGTSYDLSANRTWSVGTVTSVAAGYGINGGTITTTGTHSVDTLSVSTKAWRQKGIDSVAALLNAYVPATRTLNGLALSSNQTFATGTSGTDFNISSSGTTHTFHIPDASATARGVITTGTQTIAGAKTFSTGITVSGASTYQSNLTLGITSATTPTTFTNRYLTVDATGRVILADAGEVNSVGPIGTSPNANAASISAGVLTLQPASSSFGGVVTTGTQTFAGDKTFTGLLTSRLTPPAGTATAGTAPLKFSSGTNLTTPENGAIEYNGTNYFATSGGVRYTLAKTLTTTATLDFPNTNGFGGTSSLTVTVTGAADGDVVSLGIPSASVEDGGIYQAYVSAANTVTVVFTNSYFSSINPASGTFRITVIKY